MRTIISSTLYLDLELKEGLHSLQHAPFKSMGQIKI